MKFINAFIWLALLLSLTFMGGCSKNEGCMDPLALNFSMDADSDDGSCKYMGKVLFWAKKDPGVGYINIYVDGKYKGQRKIL